jgi:hypothetical protein
LQNERPFSRIKRRLLKAICDKIKIPVAHAAEPGEHEHLMLSWIFGAA